MESLFDHRRKSSLSSTESDWNNFLFYYPDKENHSNRKRSRRYHKTSICENSQSKRMKTSNRKQYFIRFSVDLTGQNINYTIEYHHKIVFIPFYYDFYYLSWLHSYYYYYYYQNSFQIFHQECEGEIHGDLRVFFFCEFASERKNGRLINVIFRFLAIQPPPARSWLRLASPNTTQPTAIFTIMNYNILCDKYATRHVYGYCPSWALKWDYRRKQILEELRSYSADIIALQVRRMEMH